MDNLKATLINVKDIFILNSSNVQDLQSYLINASSPIVNVSDFNVKNVDFSFYNATIISNNINDLEFLRSKLDNKLEFLTEDFDISCIPTMVINKIDLNIYYARLTKERIDSMHQLNLTVNCHLLNEKDVAELLDFWGVDYITTEKL